MKSVIYSKSKNEGLAESRLPQFNAAEKDFIKGILLIVDKPLLRSASIYLR